MINAATHRTLSMDNVTENNIRQQQTESFGRLMAGFAHDMKNHLGIIRESNGLMSDIIEMSGLDESEFPLERLQKAMSSIEQRVVIAAQMLHHLSAVAHRSDTPHSSFSVNDIITEEYTFLERFSRLQQINVTLEFEEGVSTIYNDPSLLQHALYRIYIFCLEQLAAGDSLAIITRQNAKTVEIIFRPRGTDTLQLNPEEPAQKSLHAAIQKMEGSLKTADDTDLILTIPSLTEPSSLS